MRLFIAVNFDESFKKALLRYQAELKQYADPYARVNWTAPANLHLTLAFIGEYNAPEKVRVALEEVPFAPFSIQTGRCGNFGALWWVGLDGGDEAVVLANRIRESLKNAGIPFDSKPVKPHITLAREFYPSYPPRVRTILEKTTVTHISLMKSERIAGKLTYTELYNFPAQLGNGEKSQ
ncbi:MAG: RNA 2',3'-cyclic phosphodiesterase [Eubacteriales bacterium]